MRDSFDVVDYVNYLRANWRIPAGAVLVAALVAGLVSLVLPKRYTAKVSILIEPPGVSDVRTATAVSPVYLESLKSFEHFAASDSLFADAVKRFGLQDGNGRPSIESLKRRVLRVSKPRDTKILEISATLPDPRQAHELVTYLAEQTVARSRNESLAGDREMLEQARRQLAEAMDRFSRARKAVAEDAEHENPEVLNTLITGNVEVLSEMRKQLVDAEGYAAQDESPDPGSARRATLLRKRVAEMDHELSRQKLLLSRRLARRDDVQDEHRSAQSAMEVTLSRVRDLEAAAGSRGERLRIIDPGIVPQRPSSPDPVLNIIVAMLLALVSSVLYLSSRFAFGNRAATAVRPSFSRGGMAV